MNEIINAINAMTWVEVVAVVSSGIYVVLAAKENVWCWIFGIIGAATWAYAAYAFFGLYIDALLQIYYVGISIYGWQQWTRSENESESAILNITKLSLNQNLKIIGFGLLLSFIVGFLFNNYTAAESTYLDAFTTVFSIITTALVTRKILDNWIYWIIIDSVYVYLYASREGYLFALLNIVFVIISVFGYLRWKRKLEVNYK
jgi:nicotinamide mononucleotide transporter